MKNNHIGSKDDYRLTKRKVLRYAIGLGMSPIAATHITIDDVKAADSDQVPISLDTEGNYKTNVPKDWYERLKNAEEAKHKLESKFINREGIVAVGYDAGSKKGENPIAKVYLEKNHPKKEKRRGEIPERKNGVKVDILEENKGSGDCDPGYYEYEDVPGGIQITMMDKSSGGGYCTSTSRLMNGSRWNRGYGWATNAHCLPSCPPAEWDGTMELVHKADGSSRPLGEVWFMDQYKDFVAIEAYDNVNPVSDVANPQYPYKSTRHHISGTASADGLSDLQSDDDIDFLKRGRSTCTTKGNITSLNTSQYVYQNCTESKLEDQVKWDGEVQEGDSGSLVYSEQVPYADNQRFASHMHSGSPLYGNGYGPAGYAIRNDRNMWWDDL